MAVALRRAEPQLFGVLRHLFQLVAGVGDCRSV